MSKQELQSLIEVAETIADNKFILGDRLVETGISGPNIEATLSSIAMAQQELGHSRLIYRWIFELRGIGGSNIEIKEQTGKAFRQNVEIRNWLELIAGLYTTNVAIDLVMKEILETDHPDIKPPFNKMLREQKEHLIYSNSWCKQLLRDKGSIPRRFKEALDKVSHESKEWLRKVETDPQLLTDNIISKNAKFVEHFDHAMDNVLANGTVTNVG